MQNKSAKLKLVRRIPAGNRGIISKNLALKAADEVFGPLFFTLKSQKPTASIARASYFLGVAFEAYKEVIIETYDRTISPSESTLETAEGLI